MTYTAKWVEIIVNEIDEGSKGNFICNKTGGEALNWMI